MTERAPDYIYVTYIKTTPKKVWDAITIPEFNRQYWMHTLASSDWQKGSDWTMKNAEGRVNIHGKVLESSPQKRLVISWSAPGNEKNASRAIFDIEGLGEMTKLTVTHTDLVAGTDMASGIAVGWPRVLSSLKSFLETGNALDMALLKNCDAQHAAAAQ
jgi:uncharacterized protein YndB with AHSA1/START domain